MKEGLLERIQRGGYWRVVLRPLAPLTERLSFQRCGEEVSNARVSIRGWDYPHLSRRESSEGGSERGEDYLENWCDWHNQIEFWRMYRSGQFLSYNALDGAADEIAGGSRSLSVSSAIYAVTEFIEFAHRLMGNGLYQNGYSVVLTLNNASGRSLHAGRGRSPFFDDRYSHVETIRIERRVEPGAWDLGAIVTSNSMVLELFDAFGWNPEPAQIRSDQEAFYRRDLG